MGRPARAVTDALATRLGLESIGPDGFRAVGRAGPVELRCLRGPDELEPLEDLQREVMGAADIDLWGTATLGAVPDTGGHVIGAFVPAGSGGFDPGGDDRGTPAHVLAGAVIGLGGYVDGSPRIVSDWMGVARRHRSAGIGALLKRAQAAVAVEHGFTEVVWTVDPLRAANARLNHGVLGAVGVGYAVDKWGSGYAPGLYGPLPSDRLELHWVVSDPRVQDHLAAPPPLRTVDEIRSGGRSDVVDLVEIPSDVDALLAADPAAALRERARVRAELGVAIDAGGVVTGFASAGHDGRPALVLGPRDPA